MDTSSAEIITCLMFGLFAILLFLWKYSRHHERLVKKRSHKTDSVSSNKTTLPIRPTLKPDITTYEIVSKRYYFDVPYKENTAARERGARWDSVQKQWYVVGYKVAKSFSKWVESVTKNERICDDVVIGNEQGHEGDPCFYSDMKTEGKMFLEVPYIEHESAKYLGAKWDDSHRSWYIRDSNQIQYFSRWIPSFSSITHSTLPSIPGKLYFDVSPADEKIIVSLGAQRDSKRNQWFITDRSQYHYFSKWLKGFYVVCDHLYLVQGWKWCYKCRKKTPVIAFGLESFFDFSERGAHEYVSTLYLASKIDPLPDGLRLALSDVYNFYVSSSEKGGNHCKYCGRLLGDYYLFEDFDEPFFIGFEADEWKKELVFSKISLSEDILITGQLQDCVENTKPYKFVENTSLKWK